MLCNFINCKITINKVAKIEFSFFIIINFKLFLTFNYYN